MTDNTSEVVIVGGGIVGVSTAYLLAKSGIKSTVIERDAIGSHASGFAYGGIGAGGVPNPVAPLGVEGWRLHNEFSKILPDSTGINFDFRYRSSLYLAFDDSESNQLKSTLPWRQSELGSKVRWLDQKELRNVEPRISPDAIGGLIDEMQGDLEPYRLSLALTQESEKLGATIRHGNVTGLTQDKGKVTGVVLENGKISCDVVVLALGPWSGALSNWLGTPIEIRPLKGQILRLQAPGSPVKCSVGWSGNYAITKPDGLLWAGTTEEEAGFDENPTNEARDSIMQSVIKTLPFMIDARLAQHTACLRPLASDGIPVLGRVPGWQGVFIGTGAGRQGIRLGPGMARVIVDLITKGKTKIPIDPFNPARFAKT